ncbi:sugar ABC transporter substrate-binding protein [Enterovibrio norvegicus]|uniref:Protein involved in polysaccharide export, contains SLBB domain of the beta-grasp fold n=2 Tax=Enterovibrio norvegicus TaxID=188144 RepID=A0A1I5M6X0_9GAMM|nr:SLBB domain-containing protein [Enterovibrio norvegicus]MCC4796674.1 SLBB domain-containing protein [Enterovibrio norvegicus]OEE49570.1 sugar ABC transporter substrate-binding protein [Enterovibrio norvegicus]OEF55488.1 sugar ABC transporter substrate-binding protein [Enterovibrio norvegicus]OEF61001.1 sugar ABC transporter substrate-binding protein [Enterovibrio norvegicus]PMH60832.1 sugar ABC transporter substrate-binding protein [Enterovibrio norvegicus]
MKKIILLLILVTHALGFSLTASADEYRAQIGDQIAIMLPGEVTLNKEFQIDRQGRLTLPEVGMVQALGKTEPELAEAVKETLSTVFRDLSSLQVFVSKRQLLVTIQGYVEDPGEFTLKQNASIQMALYAAGGLRTGAQLDRFQLRRNGEVLTFDYKKFLDTGDDSLLPTLNSLDTLFIPASPMIGNVEQNFDPAALADSGDAAEDRKAIKVFGEVIRPGSFSAKEENNLVDLLMRAGGVTRYASVEQIRVISSNEPRTFNLKQYLDSGDESLLPNIVEGSTIFVPKQEEEIKTGSNTVYVMGEVAKPGAYEGKDDATFIDILANAGGPTRFAESRQIRVIKADGTTVPFDLNLFTEGKMVGGPPNIEPGDAIFVPEKLDLNEKSWLKVQPDRAVRIIGEVLRPSRIEWSDEMSLLDLLAHVGGPTSRADTSQIEVVTPVSANKSKSYTFNLDVFLKEGRPDSDLPPVRAGTTVRVHDLPDDPVDNKSKWIRQSSESSIYVFGQVGAPGRYRFTNEMHFLDILSAADGPTANADLHNIRVTHLDGKHARVSRLNLAMFFETGDSTLLPDVKMGDTIYIPEKNRNWLDRPKEETIRVLGAINRPGRYTFDDHMTILDLLAEAGGPSANAYIEKITVVNMSCCRDQARTFDLSEFSRTARFQDLPVLRVGDTVYVPTKEESTAEKIRQGITDIFQIAGIAALVGIL